MRRLLINADDFGINAPRSHGIFIAFEEGIVRSTTLITNGSNAAQAAKHARERKLPTGLHLNLTDGPPMSKPADVASLLDGKGDFRDRHQQRRSLELGDIKPAHIEREIRAQIEWFLDNHGSMTHLDSHHNIHVHPLIVPLLIPILQRYGIGIVRLTLEELPPFGFEMPPDQLAFCQAMVDQATAAKELYEANGIRSPDHFRGLALSGRASAKNLRHILARLPEGTTELMVHPGSPTAIGSDFDRDPQRQTELRMLTDPAVLELLNERKIELGSFADF